MPIERFLTLLPPIHSDRKITHVSPACALTGRRTWRPRATRFSIPSHRPDLTRIGNASPAHLTTRRNQGMLVTRAAPRATKVPRASLQTIPTSETRERIHGIISYNIVIIISGAHRIWRTSVSQSHYHFMDMFDDVTDAQACTYGLIVHRG